MAQIPHVKEPLPSNLPELSDTAWADALGLHGNERDQVLKRLEQIRAGNTGTAPVKPAPANEPLKPPEKPQEQRHEHKPEHRQEPKAEPHYGTPRLPTGPPYTPKQRS